MGGAPRVWLRSPEGEIVEPGLSAAQHTRLQHRVVHRDSEGLVELAGARRDGKRLAFGVRASRENYLEAGDGEAFVARARELAARGLEVFFTPALFVAATAQNADVGSSRVCWLDIDEPAAIEALRRFGRRPHLVVASGGSGGVHAYWRLAWPVAAELCEEANHCLAHSLGGDQMARNPARLLRVAGTLNYKRQPAGRCRVVMADLALAEYTLDELCEGLAEPPARRRGQGAGQSHEGDAYREIPAEDYFGRLAGVVVPERGLIQCPHADHPDRTPSCSVGGNGLWHCFGCGAGGGIYDLASAVAGGPTGTELCGDEFREARARVREAFPELARDEEPKVAEYAGLYGRELVEARDKGGVS